MNSSVTLAKRSNTVFYCAVITLLIIRICSYFMLSEDVAITQALKVCMRIMVTLGTALLLRRSQNTFSFNQPLALILYLVYIGMGAASLLWTSSFNDTVLHLLMDAETLLFSYLFMRLVLEEMPGRKEIRLSKIIAMSIFLICGAFLIGKIINPEKFFRLTHGGEEARLGGFIINPNELGMLLVIGISATIIELKHSFNKWSKWIMMLMMIYALVITGSRSSMVGLMLIILYFSSQSKTSRMRLLMITGIIVAAPFILAQVFIKQGDVEEVMSLTGRLPFWKDLLTINFPREPLLGYGYMRIDYMDKFESINSYAGAMTHNTFLQVLMGLGLTGLFIVLLQLVATIYSIISRTDGIKKRLCIGLLIPVLINSFTEFGIFGETNYGIMFYLFIVFITVLKPEPAVVRIKGTHAKRSGSLHRSPAAA